MAIAYRIQILPVALDDMTKAVTYIASDLKNPDAATQLAERLTEGIESLSSLPTCCPLHVPSKPLTYEYRKLRVDNYLIFFSVSEQDEVVTIARVLYARRDLDSHLD